MREAIAFGVALVKLRTGVDIPTWNAKVTQGRADQIRSSGGGVEGPYGRTIQLRSKTDLDHMSEPNRGNSGSPGQN